MASSTAWIAASSWLKPIVHGLGAVAVLLLAGLGLRRLLVARIACRQEMARWISVAVAGLGVFGLLGLALSPDWLSYVVIRQFTLDASHAWISLLCMIIAAATALLPKTAAGSRGNVIRASLRVIWLGLTVAALSDLFMFAKLQALAGATRLAYTGLEVGLVISLLAAIVVVLTRVVSNEETLNRGETVSQ